ncbi:MAG: hypothetical protein AMJ81_13865 [Phycisphaerae bacterium SM23_33]|nr:MAG: hypothetical protein AMJ81_13865 [Phycisphaerae bacterium SM23_33]
MGSWTSGRPAVLVAEIRLLAEVGRQPQRDGWVELAVVGQRLAGAAHGVDLIEDGPGDDLVRHPQPLLPVPDVGGVVSGVGVDGFGPLVVALGQLVEQLGGGLARGAAAGAGDQGGLGRLARPRQHVLAGGQLLQIRGRVPVADLAQRADDDLLRRRVLGLQRLAQRPDRILAQLGQDVGDPHLDLLAGLGVLQGGDQLRHGILAGIHQPPRGHLHLPRRAAQHLDPPPDLRCVHADGQGALLDQGHDLVYGRLELLHPPAAGQRGPALVGLDRQIVDLARVGV